MFAIRLAALFMIELRDAFAFFVYSIEPTKGILKNESNSKQINFKMRIREFVNNQIIRSKPKTKKCGEKYILKSRHICLPQTFANLMEHQF